MVKRVSSMGRNYERLSFDSDYAPSTANPAGNAGSAIPATSANTP